MTDMYEALEYRFGAHLPGAPGVADNATWRGLAARGSCRSFKQDVVDPALLRTLCALALCSPTKSDLQQRDIIIVSDAQARKRIDALIGSDWLTEAPCLLVFCGNNRRQRFLHDWRGRPFANDHLDAFFNAAVDAGIALSAFMIAAESAGLGCCPLSAIRNHPEEVSAILGLPAHVFPVAGLALGWPAEKPEISLRLPLDVTVHENRYGEDDLRAKVEAYDHRRAEQQPYAKQRLAGELGEADDYCWSEDKTRQYSKPERAGFGAYAKRIGFKLT